MRCRPTLFLITAIPLLAAAFVSPAAAAVTTTISGRVTDATGAPIAGVYATLQYPQQTVVSEPNSTSGLTDAHGNYTITLPQGGSFKLCFDGSELKGSKRYLPLCYYQQPVLAQAAVITIDSGQHLTGYNATLGPDNGVTGTVTDTAGHPLAGVYASAATSDGVAADYAETGPDGSYTILGLAPGTYAVCFNPSQVEGDNPPVYVPGCEAKPVTVTSGLFTTANAALPRQATITGTATNGTGQTLPGITVTVTSKTYTGTGQTADDGTYYVGLLPPGTYTVCFSNPTQATAAVPGYQPRCYSGKPITLAEGGSATGINVLLKHAAALTGTLYQSDGTGEFDTYVDLTRVSDGAVIRTVSVQNGVYGVGGLVPGQYRVCSKGFGAGQATCYKNQPYGPNSTIVIISEGQTTKSVNLNYPAVGQYD